MPNLRKTCHCRQPCYAYPEEREGKGSAMLNVLLTSITENLSVLVVLLIWFIWHQSTRHKDMTSLRKEISDVKDELNKKIEDKVNDAKDELRGEIVKQGERVAKIEGLLMGLAPYETIAEPPPVGYAIKNKN